MTTYRAPLRDFRFITGELLDFTGHYAQLPGCEEISADVVNEVLEEAARFAEAQLVPLNAAADDPGCRWEDGEVHAPPGFKDAYRQFVAAGWQALDLPVEFGGQGLPESLNAFVVEIVGTSAVSFSAYPGLTHGAVKTLHAHGTASQKAAYLPNLVSGKWTGTMCLTEPHCGTDLGLLRTRAEPQPDGSYKLQGTKIFISAGDHDITENIVHLVLARLPDAPAGVKGISLFIVPKRKVEGPLAGAPNGVRCGSIEEKMGLHGSSTCVLSFDGADAELLGPPHKGLACMFTFMNAARLTTAQQGVVHAELGYQLSLAYARERLQMRAQPVPRHPDKPADPIIVHPDVRRMLLAQRAIAEGGRALVAYAAQMLDVVRFSPDAARRQQADDLLSFLTPIAKAFITETGVEAANLGLQCFGGHGYIRANGVEQNVRDARISTLYEGTTGIQALDLLGRKVLGTQGRLLNEFVTLVRAYCDARRDRADIAAYVQQLEALLDEWLAVTAEIARAAAKDPNEVGAASVDYLMYSGYVVNAWLWTRAAEVAEKALASGTVERDFYRSKLATARFFFDRLLPRTRGLVATMRSGAASLAIGDDAVL